MWQLATGDCRPSPLDFMPVAQYAAFACLSDLDPWSCLLLNLAVHSACGYWVALTTLSATHHHPFNYHAGANYVVLDRVFQYKKEKHRFLKK